LKAWLVTWEWANDSASCVDKLAAIYPPRWGDSKVTEHIESLFALHTYTLKELATYAKNPSRNPYSAKKQGLYIICGHNPYLSARSVVDLEIHEANGLEVITWKEPDHLLVVGKIVGYQSKIVKRRISGSLSSMSIWDRSKGDFKPGWKLGETPHYLKIDF
jgi:hypothetical protein